jgi:plasmid stability protein
MAQLIVRKIEPEVVDKLRQKAAKEGVSMEEEHRRILRSALLSGSPRPKKNFKELLASMPNVGKDSDFIMPRTPMRKVRL